MIENFFVLGSYNSGTNWIYNLLKINTKTENHVHIGGFVDDRGDIQQQWKHALPGDVLLSQQKLLVVYVIKPFEAWWCSMINRSHQLKFKPNGWVESGATSTGWMHDVYCDAITRTVNKLQKYQKHYIVARTDMLQSTSGINLLDFIRKRTDMLKEHNETIDCWVGHGGPKPEISKVWNAKQHKIKTPYPMEYELTREVNTLLDQLNDEFISSFK